MKQFYILLFTIITTVTFAQIPANYYDSANGLTGFTLKTELRDIIANGHTTRTYDQLYDGDGISGSNGYEDTHSDVFVTSGNNYENDGTLLDMYSENPDDDDNDPTTPTALNDPYNYDHGLNQCGNQSAEGDCYNREHLVPQSSFNSAFPMQSDIHSVIPTDGRVNNFRGSLPFGEANDDDWESENGSIRGSSAMAGYSGNVFEPIDEFKGDIARALLYFATRYENTVDGYTSFDMFNGTEDQVFFPWAIEVLLDWHNNVDPVDQRERDRNDEAYNFQGNANPFVDHPEYADMIWDPSPDTEAPTVPTNLVAFNPSSNTVDLTWTASTDDTAVIAYDIFVDGSFYVSTNTSSTTYTVTGLSPETTYIFTILAKDAANNMSGLSAPDSATTLAGGNGGSDCASEDFENIPTNNSSYTTRNWTGSNGSWTATDARTDQTLNGRAITMKNGVLTSPTVTGGIGELTVTTQLIFSGSSGTFDVKVNGSSVGAIPYSSTLTTTTIPNIYTEGNITVVFDNNSTDSNRVIFDDLSWTCYDDLAVEEFNVFDVKMYPNPISNNRLDFAINQSTSIQIFDILGKSIIHETIIPNKNWLNISSLNKGIYLVKMTANKQTSIKKLIRN